MGDDGMMKLGPVGRTWNEKAWDEKGRTKIAQIFISHGDRTINSIQFQYVENGRLKLSEKHGRSDGYKFDAVRLKPDMEFITGFSGHMCPIKGHVCSVKFGTNAAEYGPFGTFKADDKEFCFNLGVGGGEHDLPQFAGFHGTVGNYTVNTIGVYLNPKYAENGRLKLSQRHGSTSVGSKFDAVKLKQATEHITCILNFNGRLCSITFGTNHGQYGHFGTSRADAKEFCFNLGGGEDDPPQFGNVALEDQKPIPRNK